MSKSPTLHSKFLRHTVGKKVVKLLGNCGQGICGGTGFHIKGESGQTYIMTNGHICLLADKNDMITVVREGEQPRLRKVIHRYKTHDLCLVEGLPGVSAIGISDGVENGEFVGLIGHPGLRPISLSRGEIIGEDKISLMYGMNIPESYCIGRYFSFTKMANKEKPTEEEMAAMFFLFINSAENMCVVENINAVMLNGISYGGNSGSPVVNFYGNLVGVLFAGGQQPTDTYLVPLNEVKALLKDF